MGVVLDYMSSCFREVDTQTIVEWGDGFLRLPQSVRKKVYDKNECPMLIEPLNACCDPSVTEIDIRGPAGGAKSLLGELLIAWLIENNPGPTYYVWQSDDDGADAVEDRLMPMFEGNDYSVARLPRDRHKKRMNKISFPHMPLYIVGANYNAAQSKRIKWLIMEEPHCYRAGMLSAMRKRTEGVKDAKIITLSTGSILEDESDKCYSDGTCEEWSVCCPFCYHRQILAESNDRLKGRRDKTTVDKDGNLIWHQYLSTVEYNCGECHKPWPTGEEWRKQQAIDTGSYITTNENAKKSHRSFHYEATAVHWIPLSTIVEEKVKATQSSKRGDLTLLRDYVQKRKANAWDAAPPASTTDDQARMIGAFSKRDPFPEAISKFLCFDNQAGISREGQGEHRWYTCYGFSHDEVRLIDEGKISTWEECEELRLTLGVEPIKTFVDIAYDTARVQAQCCRYGWYGFWGDTTGKESFPHHELVPTPRGPQRVTRHYPFSQPVLGHRSNSNGTMRQAVYFWWCLQPIAQLFHNIKDGMSTYRHTIPADTSEDWKKHVAVEYRTRVISKDGLTKWQWVRGKGRKPDHLLDCSLMCFTAALMHPAIRQIIYAQSEVTVVDDEMEEKEKATTTYRLNT